MQNKIALLKIYSTIVLIFAFLSIMLIWFKFSPSNNSQVVLASAVTIAEDSLSIGKRIDYAIAVKTLEVMQLKSLIPTQTEKFQETCSGGNWLELKGRKISLSYESLNTWDIDSAPSVLAETINSKNTVLLGHNICTNGNCTAPTTDFGQIINFKPDENASACIDNKLYSGKVLYSKPVDDTATYILDDWFNKEIITAFTCYGECYDASCSSVKQRWVIVFEK